MLSILLTSNSPLLESSLLVHNKKLLSPMLAYYFGFTNIRFLSTNIGILFCFCFKVGFLLTNIGILFLFYQHCIALLQYWDIIFCLPMLDSSIPLLVNYFTFTNIGFIYTKIGILFLFYQYWFPLYQYWFPLYQYWHIILFFFYQCWIPLYHYWYIFFVLPMLGYITLYQHWYVIYLFQR